GGRRGVGRGAGSLMLRGGGQSLSARDNELWPCRRLQFRTCDPGYARYCMASCETVADRRLATHLGYRTFRVRLPEQPLDEGGFVCPASEAGSSPRARRR